MNYLNKSKKKSENNNAKASFNTLLITSSADLKKSFKNALIRLIFYYTFVQ